MKATEFLRKGADLLEERGKQYDQPGGERSMGKTVRAFNAITGRDLSEAEGWLLLQVLKDVRQWQNPEKYHADSAEDCVSYAALKAEALATSAPNDIEPAYAIDDDSDRQQLIQQSGEMAEEVYAAMDGKPSWNESPSWANFLACGECWFWSEEEPEWDGNEWRCPTGRFLNRFDLNRKSTFGPSSLEQRPQKEA